MIYRAFFSADFIQNVIRAITFLIVILIVTPFAALAMVPVGIMYVFIGQRFLKSARELKRMDSMTRSPIYSHFGETINGAPVIRAYAKKKRFIDELHARVDINHQAFAMLWISNRWLSTRISFLGAFVTLTATMSAVFTEGINPGAAGLGIAYALSFSDALIWIVRMHALMEMEMNSMERIGECNDP